MREAVSARGLDADVIAGACNGMCYAAPLVAVRGLGQPRCVIERLDARKAATLVDLLSGGQGSLAEAGLSMVVADLAPE